MLLILATECNDDENYAINIMLLKGLFQLKHSQDFSHFQLKFHCYKLNVSYMIIIYETLHVQIVK